MNAGSHYLTKVLSLIATEWNAVSAFLVEDQPDTPLEVSIKLCKRNPSRLSSTNDAATDDEDRGGDDALGKLRVELDKNGFGVEGWHEIQHGSGEIYLKCAAVPLDEVCYIWLR